ncbi:MAG: class I SAM-dependent methyltransferase [Gammaproteobacteria bacterium]|nr:class I SAM-dependent methyltransferase [Gammaproteobacteria bacterium]
MTTDKNDSRYAPRVKHSMHKAEAYLQRKPEKHAKEMRLIADAFASVSGIDSVLDAPCGVGRASIWLAQQGYRVTAVDLGEAALQVTREQAQKAAVEVKVERQNVFQMTYDDRSFDAVLCFRLLHHFADARQRRELIQEMCRVADRFVVISYHSPRSIAAIRRRIRHRLYGKEILQYPSSRQEMVAGFAAAGYHLHQHSSWSPWLHSLQLAVFARD